MKRKNRVLNPNLRALKILFLFGLINISIPYYWIIESICFNILAKRAEGVVTEVDVSRRYPSTKNHSQWVNYYCPKIRYKANFDEFVEFSDDWACVKDKDRYYWGQKVSVFYKQEKNIESRAEVLASTYIFVFMFSIPGWLFMMPYTYVTLKKLKKVESRRSK